MRLSFQPTKFFSRGKSCALLLAASFLGAPSVQAKMPAEELTERTIELTRSSGLSSYLQLRQLWGLWEKEDPKKVEAALSLMADSHQGPEASYARVLLAYARLRRGDIDAAKRIFASLGYVQDFFVVGPFDNEGKEGFSEVFEPDANPGAAIIPGQAFSGKIRPVRYREVPHVFPFGFVDAGSLLRPVQQGCAFFVTFVESAQAQDAQVFLGGNGAYRLDLNGREVLSHAAYRGFDFDRQGRSIRLRAGTNRLSVKICGAEEAPLFALRLLDAQGKPLQAEASLELSQQAEAVVAEELAAAPPKQKAAKGLGPLDAVLKIAENKGASAKDLRLAAEYLRVTQGDDEAAHQARDLAARAVEKEPTNVEGLLLFAALAEDRNQARALIARAREAAGDAADQQIELLLAEARLLRSGPNPRQAFPIYDRILLLDPDDLEALSGRVELYNAAGLKRSALSAIETALERNPHSVRLLGMAAAQRDALGFSSSAQDAEERYSALRLDDPNFLQSRLDLALARRDEKAAAHWISRLVETEPQELYSYFTSAQAQRRLGHLERAVSDLNFARELAPEDIGVLKELAEYEARAGNTEAQLALLEEVLRLRPQEVDVRQYVEFIRPPVEPADEKYAMPAEDFLDLRHAPKDGQARRTLRDLTVTTVYENGLSRTFKQVVFQPLTDAAAALGRQYAFGYQADRQRVQLKGAKVYRADGSIDEAIESGQAAANDPSISMYTSGRTFYVQFPRLEPGDVVELRYRIDDVTPRNEFADYFGDVVYMQDSEPVQNAEYVLITPKSRKISVDEQLGGIQLTTEETEDSRIHRFRAEQVPELQPEPSMPPLSEVLGFVHVSTYQSWEDLGRWYWGLVKEQFDTDPETRKLALSITENAKTDEEKVKAVYGWVVKNTRYVALEFGIYGFKPRRCVQTVARGWGDCKDKATVIVTLLRELGIDAHLVILRTQMRGAFPSQLPSLAPFDHAIAYVPSLDLYLDGTAEHTGAFELPAMDQGAMGLQILDGKSKLVTLPENSRTKNQVERELSVQLKSDGSAQFSLDLSVQGSSASSYRHRYGAEATRFERISSDMGASYPGLEINKKSLKVSDLTDIETSPTFEFTAQVKNFARREGEDLSVAVSPQLNLTSSYASLSARKEDVRILGVPARKERVVVQLPAGAKVLAQPPSESFDSPFGSFSLSSKQEGNQLIFESEMSFKVIRVAPQDYAAFRDFCVRVDRAFSQRLLIQPAGR